MRNDLEKIKDITCEMALNDMIYRKMQCDLDEVKEYLLGEGISDTETDEYLLDEIYFYKRVMSLLSDNDIPFKACVGLFVLEDILPTLYDEKERFIGESDRDVDIFEFVIEYGYRNYGDLKELDEDEFEKTVRNAFDYYYDYIDSDGEENDE